MKDILISDLLQVNSFERDGCQRKIIRPAHCMYIKHYKKY